MLVGLAGHASISRAALEAGQSYHRCLADPPQQAEGEKSHDENGDVDDDAGEQS